MPTHWQDALDYIADLRRRGVGERQIGRQLRKSGWKPEQVQALLRGEAAPAAPESPAVLPPAPPALARPSRPPLDAALPWVVALVLVAIVGAGFAPRFRGRSAEATCLSRAQELVRAMRMYAVESDGYLPAGVAWPSAVAGHLPHPGDLLCPADRRREKQSDGRLPTSYTMSRLCSSVHTDRASGSQVQLLFDGQEVCGDAAAAAFRHEAPPGPAVGPGAMKRPGVGSPGRPSGGAVPPGKGVPGAGDHAGGLNVAFADGHVAWEPQAQFAMTPLEYPIRGPMVSSDSPLLPVSKATVDPTRRYDLVRGNNRNTPQGPSSSSDRLRASVLIEAPDTVYAEERFTATAHGSYTLSSDLRRLIRAGKAQVKEGYRWESFPVVIVGGHQPRGQKVTAYCRAEREDDTLGEAVVPGLWVSYVVAVRMPDGSYQWARAENHVMPKVWRFGILPVSPSKRSRRDDPHSAMLGQAPIRQPVRFEAQGFRDPGDAITSGITWEWQFDDGPLLRGNPVTRTFTQCGDYYVIVRGTYQGRTAEDLQSLNITSNDSDDMIVGRVREARCPPDRLKEIQLKRGYAPPRK